MKLRLDYGSAGLEVELPDANVAQVLGLRPAPPLMDAATAVRQSLTAPIGCAPLSELAVERTRVCIVVCDITRPVPNKTLLPPILETLHAAGVAKQQITILIATGTHRPNLGDELDRLIGSKIASEYTVVNHDCRDDSTHVSLGVSPAGVPVALDRVFVEADLRITVGLIEPHFMAGFSGGRKLVMPGIASFETISNWHCPRFLESPLSQSGTIEGNPVHAESLAIAKMCRPDFIMDVTLDEQNQITGIFAGDLEQAWYAGVAFASEHVRARVDVPADIVVTSCAGSPLDASFYQAVKGMVGALPAVKKGGSIVIASECAEGLGSPDFARVLTETSDLEEFVEYISQPGVFVPEEWQVEELARAVRHAEVYCVTSGIAPETLSNCFVMPAKSVEYAVALAMRKHGANASIIAIPRGPYVIPDPNG